MLILSIYSCLLVFGVQIFIWHHLLPHREHSLFPIKTNPDEKSATCVQFLVQCLLFLSDLNQNWYV